MASGGCLHNRYLNVIKGYLKGDLGPDYKYPNRNVQELILGAFPVSLELAEGNQLTRCWLLVVGCPAVQDFRENGSTFPNRNPARRDASPTSLPAAEPSASGRL